MSAEPREPSTVEKRTKTGVSASAARKAAFVTPAAVPYDWKTPCAPAPRAWTTRSGMRSWSKCMIFSRRWWSWRRTGPRGPALSEWSVSYSRVPCAVVRYAPLWATRAWSAPVGWPVGLTVSGPVWSGFGGSGPCGSVGSSTVTGPEEGAPGTPSAGPFSRKGSVSLSTAALRGFSWDIVSPRSGQGAP